jgi:hypothetical protein
MDMKMETRDTDGKFKEFECSAEDFRFRICVPAENKKRDNHAAKMIVPVG